jgi:hypothetical protein
MASLTEAALPQRDVSHGAITVHTTARARQDGATIGRLDVRVGRASQRIELEPRWVSPQMLVASVALVDANFDGHPDLVVLREFGATSSRAPGNVGASDVYLYDPHTRRFSNASPLARSLGHLANATFDEPHRRVTTHDIGPSRPSRHAYTVAGNALRLVESCTFLNDTDPHAGTVVHSTLVGGQVHTTFHRVRMSPSDIEPCGP